MSREWIKFTDQQRVILRPYIERVQNANVLGSPGMLIGQVSWDSDATWIVPCYVPHQKAVFLEEQGNTSIPGRRAPCNPGQHQFIRMTAQDRRRKLPVQKVCLVCGEVQAT